MFALFWYRYIERKNRSEVSTGSQSIPARDTYPDDHFTIYFS